ncbi:SDR family oxidoreductase [Xylophilus sp. GOD-11R]|uniref:SDR family oxidoreductase n=1 Tax=Xylophilus sp. GOD-11R TaxID=3089814 RepID=UPI00298BE1E8|nr:SDR family oxidoreductase [Xylophilus sp. GOD-11R]WPB57053.1 SDR family oxidoreductase [Xylophilus sp. GOD-11R]
MTASPLVFITGASSGIGQALALHYYHRGWRLALVARRQEAIDTWAAEQRLETGRWASYRADVAVIDSIVGASQACIAAQGLPDVVIANAGISVGIDSADRSDIDVLAESFATNTVGMAATFHAFVAPMAARGSGRLVGIASIAGIRGLPGHGAYSGSKAGAIAYCESLRGDLRGSGVRVVTLCPGYVDTPLTQGNRYAMPFMLTPSAFAEKAVAAIDSGAALRVIPWQMSIVARVMRLLPPSWYDRLVAGRGRKKRRGEA